MGYHWVKISILNNMTIIFLPDRFPQLIAGALPAIWGVGANGNTSVLQAEVEGSIPSLSTESVLSDLCYTDPYMPETCQSTRITEDAHIPAQTRY